VPALEFGHEFQELECGFHHYYHDFSYALQDLVHCHFHEYDIQIDSCPGTLCKMSESGIFGTPFFENVSCHHQANEL
jgi:hypothetical protein